MGAAETAKMMAVLTLKDELSKGLRTAQGNLGKFETGLGRTGKGFGQLGAGLARVGVIAGAAAAGGIAAAAKMGGDFEAQLRIINTVARESEEGLTAIGDGIRALARTSGSELPDLTQAYYDLLSAGIATADAQNVLTQANTLAIGGLGTTAETVDLLTSAINTYGGDASKAAAFTDMFAVSIDRGKVTAAQLSESFATVGQTAVNANIGLDELAAGYARLTATGVPAAEAATQMRSAIVSLTRRNKNLKDLEKATGRSYLAIAGKEGLVVALQQLRNDADKAGVPLIELMGRVEGTNFALATTGPNFDAFNEDLAAVRDGAGTAAEQMGERQQGLNFQLTRLKRNLQDAGLTLASGFLPALTRSADKLTKFLDTETNREFLKALGEDIGKAIDNIDWKDVGNAAKSFVEVLKSALSVAKAMYDIFNALPTEIKGAAVGFLALNKLSGGLLGSGVGNIVGGLGQSIARNIGSSLPGVAGKAFIQKVFVVNMGMGGMGGGAAGAAAKGGMGMMSKMFLVGEAIGLAALVYSVQQGFSEQSTQQAAKIREGLDSSIAGKSLPELKTAMGGVKQGIADLRANPLLTLVQGEALTTLQAMEGDLKAQIQKLETIKGMSERTKDDTVAATEKTTRVAAETKRETGRGLALVKTAADRTRDAAMETKREAGRGLSIVTSTSRSNTGQIVSTIRANRPQTFVSVNISAVGVRSSVDVKDRTGTSSGSRNKNTWNGDKP